MKSLYTLLTACLVLTNIHAQDCKVKLQALQGTYEGDCKGGKANGYGSAKGEDTYVGEFKSGFPNGKGTYTWTLEQKTFEGQWKKGRMYGKGTMTYKHNDSIVTGFWKNNIYVGLYEKPYKVINKTNLVHQLNIKRYDDPVTTMRLYIKKNETRVNFPQANVIITKGSFQDILTQRDFIELTKVTFPLAFKVIFEREQIQVELFQSGRWQVTMEIREIEGLRN